MTAGYRVTNATRSTPRTNRIRIPSSRRYPCAMTLIELTVALSISSTLLIVIGGTIGIAAQSLPGKQDSSNAYLDHASRVNEMATELRYATSVITSSLTVIEFTVADRDRKSVV